MESTRRQLELLGETLESAIAEAENERARYHIRSAAQRVVVLETLETPEAGPSVDGLLDPPAADRGHGSEASDEPVDDGAE